MASPSSETKPKALSDSTPEPPPHDATAFRGSSKNHPSPLAFGLLLTGVCLSAFIAALDRIIVATAIPRITDEFVSPQDIGWYGSAYLLTSCAFQPIYGRAYIHFDNLRTYILALFFFELGSLICGVAPTSTALIVGRAIAGVGSAGLLAGNVHIISLITPISKRALYLGLVGSIFGIGSVSGPIIGGVLTSRVTWRWCFYINLPVGGVTAVTIILFFRPQEMIKTNESFLQRLLRLDLLGNLLIITATVMLLLALQWGGTEYAWKSPRIIGLLAGFTIEALLFGLWQKFYGTQALLPLDIVTQRTVLSSIAAAFCLSGTIIMYSYYLPYWFQVVRNASPLQSGIDTIPWVAGSFVSAILAGAIVNKVEFFNPPALVGPIVGAVGTGLLYTLQVDTPAAKWIGYQVLGSFGVGAAVQQYFLAVQAVLPSEDIPIGTALILFSQNLSGAIFVSVGNNIIRNKLLHGLSDAAFQGVDVTAIVADGATDIRDLVPGTLLGPLLRLFNSALQDVFLVAVPLTILALVCAVPMEWKNLKETARPVDIEL